MYFPKISSKHFYWIYSILAVVLFVFALRSPIAMDEVNNFKLATTHENLNTEASHLLTPVTKSFYHFADALNNTLGTDQTFLYLHIIGFLFGATILLFMGLLVKEISTSQTYGVLAMILFFLSPRQMGQLCNNLEDIPMMLAFTGFLLFSIRFYNTRCQLKTTTIIGLGTSLLAALVLHPLGSILIIISAFIIPFIGLHKRPESFNGRFKHPLLWFLLVCAFSYFFSILINGYSILEPFQNITEAYHYTPNIYQTFAGKWMNIEQLPAYYLPLWMFISTPEIIWVGIALWLINSLFEQFFAKERKAAPFFNTFILIISILIPVSLVVSGFLKIIQGWHALYFLYPAMIVLSVSGIKGTVSLLPFQGRLVLSLVLFGLLIIPGSYIFYNFSPDYVYFNQVPKGNKGAFTNYEYDYRCQHLQKAVRSLNITFPHEDKVLSIASDFDISVYPQIDQRFKVHTETLEKRSRSTFDYAVFSTNSIHPWALRYDKWYPAKAIYTYNHRGNPSAVVLRTNSSFSTEGFSAFEKEDYGKAAQYFKRAYNYDPYDLYLCSYLAKAYLKTGNIKAYMKDCHHRKYINPFYMPFRFTEAEYYYTQGKFEQCSDLLNYILNDDPYFNDAWMLLEKCNEKLNSDWLETKQ